MKINTIDSVLTKATQLCQQRAVRLTPLRLQVLKLMVEQTGAISAYDLLDLLKKDDPKAKPPTIYRVLDFLLEQGFIHKVESTNSYVVCHHIEHTSHTSALFICQNCSDVAEYDCAGIEQLLSTIAVQNQFTLKHSVIETHGICTKCKA